jgi:hypothetical protein
MKDVLGVPAYDISAASLVRSYGTCEFRLLRRILAVNLKLLGRYSAYADRLLGGHKWGSYKKFFASIFREV